MEANGNRRAPVVGLGISGISTALRLRQIGWTPVVVERAPARRTGGYFIAMFGGGRPAARRLGILDNLKDRMPRDGSSFGIDRAGNRRVGLGYQDLPGRPWMMLRGDVEEAAFAALPDDVEIRYSTSGSSSSTSGRTRSCGPQRLRRTHTRAPAETVREWLREHAQLMLTVWPGGRQAPPSTLVARLQRAAVGPVGPHFWEFFDPARGRAPAVDLVARGATATGVLAVPPGRTRRRWWALGA